MNDPVIRPIPLDRLERSPANVRRTEAGKTAFAELKASILAHGLLENLVARSIGPGEDGGEHFVVIAGARRLDVLNDLASDGVLDADHPVPCRVIGNGAIDSELSLAENVIRVAMHPADQVQAFGTLANDGASVADIAARFGVSERTVEQRLRLGNAAPEILDAYRAGEIDLETLKAFAVTTDRARQMAVWEQVSDQGYRPSGWQIKRMLTQDRVPAASAIATFVGVDAYEAAGGAVDRDLFADQDEWGIWFEDADLLSKLAMDRLQAAADELATRWKWADARIEVNWSDLARFGRVHPTPGETTDEEKAEVESLHVRHDELVNMDEDEWTEALANAAESIETRLAEIEAAVEARAVFRPEDIAISGCIVTVSDEGRMQLVQGLVRPEDIPAAQANDATDTAQSGTGDDAAASTGDGTSGIQAPAFSGPAMPHARPDAEAEARKEAGVGIGLGDDLRSIRTALVKAHLAEDFGAAFDLMLFQMGRAVFTPGYHDHAFDIAVRETPDRPPLRANDDSFADASPGEAMLADRSHLSFDWLAMEDDGEAFAALCALPEADKQRLFAACVARTVKGQLAFEAGARPETEATVARLDIDFAAHVRPTAELFWSRLRKDRMLAVAREVLGVEWTHTHRKDKKATLASAMETAFAKSDGVPLGVTKEGHAAALAWAPPGFAAFDTGRIDDGEDAAAATSTPPADQTQADTRGEPATEPANGTDDAASAEAPPAAPSAPTETPRRTSVVESIESPATAERRAEALGGQDAIDAMNAVPVAGGGPRVIVNTVGLDEDEAGNESPDADPPGPPVPGNGHESVHDVGGDALDIPAFLRRS